MTDAEAAARSHALPAEDHQAILRQPGRHQARPSLGVGRRALPQRGEEEGEGLEDHRGDDDQARRLAGSRRASHAREEARLIADLVKEARSEVGDASLRASWTSQRRRSESADRIHLSGLGSFEPGDSKTRPRRDRSDESRLLRVQQAADPAAGFRDRNGTAVRSSPPVPSPFGDTRNNENRPGDTTAARPRSSGPGSGHVDQHEVVLPASASSAARTNASTPSTRPPDGSRKRPARPASGIGDRTTASVRATPPVSTSCRNAFRLGGRACSLMLYNGCCRFAS